MRRSMIFQKDHYRANCKYLDCRIMENGFVFPLSVSKLKKRQPPYKLLIKWKAGNFSPASVSKPN